jgi:hypothetical protein
MIEYKDDHGQPMVKVDYKKKCTCEQSLPTMVNYSMMWHEADIVCAHCTGFIRYWDAG